jgi:hypothetical protein
MQIGKSEYAGATGQGQTRKGQGVGKTPMLDEETRVNPDS